MAEKTWVLSCFHDVFSPNATNLEGDNVIVPQRILEDIQDIERAEYRFVVKRGLGSQTICCKVEEFCPTNDSNIYMPSWMMHNLYLNDMDEVTISLLESEISIAKKIIVQPHDSVFLTLQNHKSVLEESLKKFSTLTVGTSISISHNEEAFSLSVVGLDPAHQYVSLIDTDVEVEFMPPLDYVEMKPDDWPASEQWPLDPGVYIKEEIHKDPKEYVLSNEKRIIVKPPTPSPPPVTVSPPRSFLTASSGGTEQKQETKFVPFSGKGNRLGN